jgi:four helix bundle protein
MAKVARFEELDAWQKARDLTRAVYERSDSGRFAKDFGLRDQIRRAAVSVMSNIAEGFERGGDQEFLQFLSMARGSCGEVRAQLYVALDQSYLDQNDFTALLDAAIEVSRLIAGLMRYLRQSGLKGSKYR